MTKKEKVRKILERLYKIWPHPKTELHYSTPFQLMIAVMLSTQTPDRTTNMVTRDLFSRYPDAKALADAPTNDIDSIIDRINYHHNKAKYIKDAARIITDKYGGTVPDSMIELIAIPGIGRKVANVLLNELFNKHEGIAVDTHVMRLSQALGLTSETHPVKIEKDLMKIVPKKHWTAFSHLLILYGRYYCPARKIVCRDCMLLKDLCGN